MTSLRRRVAATALLLLVPALSACGFSAQTDQVYQPATGVDNRDGQVNVLNALIVSAHDGAGTFAGTLVNTNLSQADQLVSITDSKGTVAIPVPPNGLVNLATAGEVRLKNADIVPGGWVSLTLQFASGQTTQIDAPVVQNKDEYADIPVGPTGSQSATGAASSTPTQ